MSTDSDKPPIARAEGVTASERYLKTLCDRSFLSMWSYPGLFVKKTSNGLVRGRELCDLFVAFDNNLLIFSDRTSQFGPAETLELSLEQAKN